MTTHEMNFWQWFRGHLPGHVMRLENSVSLGVPDVNVCFSGVEYWLELKVWVDGTGILIRKEQWAWHARRMLSGGRCWVACYQQENDIVLLKSTDEISVKAYGTQGKYVLVANPTSFHAVKKAGLTKFLKTYLFTSRIVI